MAQIDALNVFQPKAQAQEGQGTPPEMPTKPNFVLIMADDMGYSDWSGAGHPTIRTPNLERMASDGLTMTQSTRATLSARQAGPRCSQVGITSGRACSKSSSPWAVMASLCPKSPSPKPSSLLATKAYASASGTWGANPSSGR
jgi:hypothetical protein